MISWTVKPWFIVNPQVAQTGSGELKNASDATQKTIADLSYKLPRDRQYCFHFPVSGPPTDNFTVEFCGNSTENTGTLWLEAILPNATHLIDRVIQLGITPRDMLSKDNKYSELDASCIVPSAEWKLKVIYFSVLAQINMLFRC